MFQVPQIAGHFSGTQAFLRGDDSARDQVRELVFRDAGSSANFDGRWAYPEVRHFVCTDSRSNCRSLSRFIVTGQRRGHEWQFIQEIISTPSVISATV